MANNWFNPQVRHDDMPGMPKMPMHADMRSDGRAVPIPHYSAENDSSHGKSMKLGGGGRFAKLKAKIAARGNVRNPGAVAAAIGRKKYGTAKFQKMAAAGRKRAK